MGTDYSVHKSRTVSPYDEGMTLRLRNNYHPLHFHQVHGENIKLSKNGAVACRSEGFCKGIVFSDRPVLVNEPVYIKFVEISANWSGALRVGFTMHDPVSMKSKLPRYVCPDLTVTHGNWAKAVAERLAKKDSVLHYHVDHNGDVHYGIDNEEFGVFFGGVNTSAKLWAVLDIYGNTVAVEFVDPSTLIQDTQHGAHTKTNPALRNKEKFPPTLDISCLNFNISFHHIHGKNVTLKKNRSVISRKPGMHSLAYAFTERPLKLGEKVVLQILQTDHFFNGTLIYGVTSCNPSSIEPCALPENADDLLDRPEYWIVRQDSNAYEIGDIIVYTINNDGELTVTTNGEHRIAVLHVDPTQPLWLFINVIGSISEVWLVGATSDGEVKMQNRSENNMPEKLENAFAKPGPSNRQQSISECVICYEEPVNCVLYRCGHMCMCYSCGLKMWEPDSNVQCPICRETIQDIIKTFS